jgi:hypothetical protein
MTSEVRRTNKRLTLDGIGDPLEDLLALALRAALHADALEGLEILGRRDMA